MRISRHNGCNLENDQNSEQLLTTRKTILVRLDIGRLEITEMIAKQNSIQCKARH